MIPLATDENQRRAAATLARRHALKGTEGKSNRELLKAIEGGELPKVAAALQAGANPNVLDREGLGAMHRAVLVSKLEILTALIEAGGDPNLPTDFGAPPIFYTAERTTIEMLLRAGADVNARTEGGMTALHRGAFIGDAAWAAILLDHGAALEPVDDDGDTPLDKAVRARNANLILLLARRGANLTTSRDDDGSALDRARNSFLAASALHDFLALKRDLAAEGILDPRIEELAKAASVGDSEVIRSLIEAGTDVNGRADFDRLVGATPLYFAAAANRSDSAELLIDAGADVSAAVVYDDTVEPNRPRTLEERMRARPQGPAWLSHQPLDTLRDVPPLVVAARLGHADVLRVLLKSGADPEFRKRDFDQTPLMIAVRFGHESVAQELIRAGADVDAILKASRIGESDRTALSIALALGDRPMERLLRSAGAALPDA